MAFGIKQVSVNRGVGIEKDWSLQLPKENHSDEKIKP
jgi:hypothetical protein